jgi:hypothetical protein
MLKPYHFTLQMPACVTVCATARVEPEVNGSNWPSARLQNRSVIAVGKMRNSSSTCTLDYTVDDSTGSFPIPKLGASGVTVFSTTNGSSLLMASQAAYFCRPTALRNRRLCLDT